VPLLPGAATPPLEAVRRAVDAMHQRGPDARWTGTHGNCALGSTRLSIVDRTPASNPPIVDATGQVVLLYNGELYEADSLRNTLAARGYPFKSRGDGEVVLAAYLEYGVRFLREIDGMFALAIVDLRERASDPLSPPRLLLARDRFGEKPLLFARAPAGIAFASTAAALRKLVTSVDLNLDALADIVRHGFVPSGATALRGVYRVKPGTALVVVKGEAAVYPFAERQIYEFDKNENLVHEFWKLLKRANRRRARSEAGLGVFLSGGLDSTAIACALHEDQIEFHAYAAGFRGEHDERELARSTADRLGQHLEFIELGPEILDDWEPLTREIGEPLANASILNISALARRARRDVSVVLTGEGGDELFGGYRRERAYHAIARMRMPGIVAKTIESLPGDAGRVGRALGRSPGIGRYQELRDHVSAAEELLLPDFRKGDAAADEALPGGATAHDSDLYSYLPNDLLFRLDAATMASSIEARAPFLDPDLADFAQSLPTGERYSFLTGKKLIRRALLGRAPDSVVRGRKRGFGAPLKRWFRETAFAQEILAGPGACAPPLSRHHVEAMLADHRAGRRDASLLLARAIGVELFRRTFRAPG
jgi:asparagine synthase (glutamine-hydrolysing)